ncbi:MAG: hypothetical protein ABSB35_28475 [Bryobacteraceae bacterium]
MKTVWPDTFVEESNLTQNIFVLRKALGETPGDRRYVVRLGLPLCRGGRDGSCGGGDVRRRSSNQAL